jgi:hydroxypyruvate isomerase
MRLVANLSIIFARLPFLQRFAAASAAGFDLVEFWWPHAEFASGLTENQIVDAVRRAGARVEMLNFDGGDLPSGDRGLAGDPKRAAEFRANVPRALALASRLGCTKLNALAGTVVGASASNQRDILRESVAFAADAAANTGATVLVEPLNIEETPGYLLPDVASALALIDHAGVASVRLQLDVYHVARGGDDPVAAIRRAAGRIGHVQIADVPGRHEPGTGNLDFAAIFRTLQAVGYGGNIGLEYVPTNPNAPDFAYRDPLRVVLDGIVNHTAIPISSPAN